MQNILSWLLALMLFPGIALGIAALYHYGRRRPVPGTFLREGVSLVTVAGAGVTYLLALGISLLYPTWNDAGAITKVHFPGHFGWAWLISFFLQFLIIIPMVLFHQAFSATRKSREARQR